MSEFKTAIQYTVTPDCVVVKQVWGEGPHPRNTPPRASKSGLLDAEQVTRFISDINRLKSAPYRTFV